MIGKSGRWALAGLILALAAFLPAAGRETPRGGLAGEGLNGIYDFFVGGIWAGELTLSTDVAGDRYRAGIELRTAGVVGFFFSAGYKAEAIGRVGADGLLPERYAAASHDGRELRLVEMSFDGDRPLEVRADPAYDPRPWAIEPREQAGTADPVSAAVATLGPAPQDAVCNRTADIFDGRRRFAVELRAPMPDGDRIRCQAAYIRLAGFKPKMMRPDRARKEFTVEFALRGDGLYHVVRATAPTDYGTAVLLLRD